MDLLQNFWDVCCCLHSVGFYGYIHQRSPGLAQNDRPIMVSQSPKMHQALFRLVHNASGLFHGLHSFIRIYG
ncbi:hypothetical protein VTN96DRAFT_5345 [Rasamsonia emersonii]